MSTEIRDLAANDLPEVVRVLCEGFPHRDAAYWQRGLDHMSRLDTLPDTVRFGHGLFVDGTMRGVILAIPSRHGAAGRTRTVVNLSSWSVDPGHRGRAALQLYTQASSRHPDITYTNLSATAKTLKAVVARGFQESTAGQMLCLGARPSRGPKRFVSAGQSRSAGLSESVARTLVDHEALGCVTVCVEARDTLIPLVFLKRRVKGIPLVHLIYCESLTDLAAHGLAVSGWLAARGYPAMIVDASAPVPGLLGKYFPGKARKFFKGPAPAPGIDHTYSEMMYFGL